MQERTIIPVPRAKTTQLTAHSTVNWIRDEKNCFIQQISAQDPSYADVTPYGRLHKILHNKKYGQ